MKFVKVCCTRARGSRTHQRSSSLRPTVLKTAAATGPHALSSLIVEGETALVNRKLWRNGRQSVSPNAKIAKILNVKNAKAFDSEAASALIRNYQKTFAALAFSAPLRLNP